MIRSLIGPINIRIGYVDELLLQPSAAFWLTYKFVIGGGSMGGSQRMGVVGRY